MQIAFNIGQFMYCLDNNFGTHIYTTKMIEYYLLHRLHQIDTYINLSKIRLDNYDTTIKWINDEITNIKK